MMKFGEKIGIISAFAMVIGIIIIFVGLIESDIDKKELEDMKKDIEDLFVGKMMVEKCSVCKKELKSN